MYMRSSVVFSIWYFFALICQCWRQGVLPLFVFLSTANAVQRLGAAFEAVHMCTGKEEGAKLQADDQLAFAIDQSLQLLPTGKSEVGA